MRKIAMETKRYSLIVLVIATVVIAASSCGSSQQTATSESKQTSAPSSGSANISSTEETSKSVSSECENAVKGAAEISDMKNTVEDLDPAIQKCQALEDFTAAANKYPQALDGVDAKTFATNRCTYNPALQNTSICKELLKR